MATRDPALQGTVADLPLPDLLHLLAGTGQTGIVELSGETPGLVAFHEGSITLAISAMGPTLQQVFIGSGLTTAEQWDELTAAADAGTPLTTSLLASGVDEERLRAVLYDHTVGAVFELMLPSEDSFTFVAGQTHPIGTTFPFPVDEVLEDAGQRVEAWKVIAVAIPSTSMRMRLAHELPRAKLTVSADEWHVLSRVDGRATIAEIIRELGMSAFAVCAVLHRLLQAGAVEPAPDE